jgi:surface antigen
LGSVTWFGRFGRALIAVAMACALLAMPASPAQAVNRYLCTGYSACQQAGYPHYGYRGASDQMWWRMFAGHNCTNYVAYRLVKGGMSPERPWDSTGMAYNWGVANDHLRDDVPMVGAVAWWRRNAPGAGSSGHVAYVEEVVSAKKIVISEDSWSGDFHWRVLTRDSGRWPTGFLHFDDRAVEPVEAPGVSGHAAVGETLTVATGRWTPEADTAVQWLAAGEPIPGATGATLTLTPDLLRSRISAKVTATERGYLDGRATTVATSRVAKGTMTATSQPAVTGIPRVDEVLELVPGAWTPTPDSTVVRWFADGEPVAGAAGSRLRVGQELIGKRITVRATARLEGYRLSAQTSAPTAEVTAGRFEVTSPFDVRGALRPGRELRVVPGVVEPADAQVTYRWLRDGAPIEGATGTAYTLGVADVGRRITLQVDLRRSGYRDRTLLVETDGVVRTRPELQVRATGRPGRAIVRVTVEAPGVVDPGGRVTVRVGGRTVEGQVREGRLRVVVPDLAAGTRTVRVRYAGTDVVLPGRARTTVDVPRR